MSAAKTPATTARDQVARLLALVPYLHSRGEVSVSEAAAALDVAPDQLVRDLRVLFLCGLPGGYPDDLIDVDLDALEGEGIIRVSNADYLAHPVRFAPSEAAALVVALRAIGERTPSARDVVARTLAKFEAAGAGSSEMHVASEPQAAPGDLLALLQGAVDRGHQVELTYHVPTRDEQAARTVDPRAVTHVGEVAYLDAWCHTAQGDRAFRLDRIVEARELETPVASPGSGPRDLTGEWFSGAETTRVTLALEPPAHWVPEYYTVVDQRPGPEGILEVDLDVAGEPWLRQLLLRLAPHARVVRPQEFNDSFTAGARDALSLYQDSGVR